MLIPYFKNDNCILFNTNNIILLQELPNESIDLIYCDILYNTGKKFKDFDDNLGTPQEAMEWYKPRLEHMKRVLKNNGSIYIHCDWHLNSYIRILMDEIFGYKNLINEIIWCYTSGGKSTKTFSKKHDTIYFYSKSNKYKFNADDIRIPYSEKTLANYKEGLKGSTYTSEVKLNPLGKIPEDYWNIAIATKSLKENIGYDTQKPKALLERIIKTSSNKDDMVADFFMGSGTTGEVALELGRKFIGCDINEKACEISKERLEKL